MDYKGFMRAKFIPRTAFIEVPEIAEWFGKDQAPGFMVRGLSGDELAISNLEATKDIVDLSQKLLSGVVDSMSDALKVLFDAHTDEIPSVMAKNFHLFMFGLLTPDIPEGERLEFAEKFSKRLPVDFLRVTNKITELTGMGQTAEKQPGASSVNAG
jgi:hypothetical protein